MLLWSLDQTLDPGQFRSHWRQEYLYWLAKRRAPLREISGDQLSEEVAAALTAEILQDALEDSVNWPEG